MQQIVSKRILFLDMHQDCNNDVDDLEVESVGESDEVEEADRSSYLLTNAHFVVVVSNFKGKKVKVESMSEREYSLVKNHSVETAVSLCHKMLDSVFCDDSTEVILQCLRHIHANKVHQEFIPALLIMLVKYHFYN